MKLTHALLAIVALSMTVACATPVQAPPPVGPSPSETAAYQDLDRETANGPTAGTPPVEPVQ
jgi:hypothetical protein